MIYLPSALLNVPASPAVSVQAPIPRSGLVHGEGFRALQRTKASHAGTRVGSGTELWGFVLWPGREAAVRS